MACRGSSRAVSMGRCKHKLVGLEVGVVTCGIRVGEGEGEGARI